jgi:predicted ribosomally synthesized peptide with SipW-like signal peptide
MKKILFGIMAIVLCIGLMGAAFATFSDTASSTGNKFTAGTLDLKIDNDPSSGAPVWVDSPTNKIQDIAAAVNNLKPGDSFSSNVGIFNAGTIAGTPSFKLTVTANDENGVNGPESLVDSTTGASQGELSAYVNLKLSYGGSVIFSGTLDQYTAMVTPFVAPTTLAPLTEGSWDYTVSIDSSVGNIIQSDSCTFDIVFGLAQ